MEVASRKVVARPATSTTNTPSFHH